MDATTIPPDILATISYPTLPILQFAPTYPRGIAGGITFQLAPAGSIMRGTGRFKSIMGSNRLHRYRFGQVQLMTGGGNTEGVTGNADTDWNCGWICLWSADGQAPIL